MRQSTVQSDLAKKPLRHARIAATGAGSLACVTQTGCTCPSNGSWSVARSATHEEEHQRLPKRIALPVFASDAISSTAYATDEILLVLLGQAAIGAAAWQYLTPLAVVVCVLLTIVVLSYRQTIYAYPSGGGSYIVSKENLGTMPALVAGASLLVDYILTVAVSIAAGVLAITSAVPSWSAYRVEICLAMILLMMLANLRGLKESGSLFAPPTYIYIVMLILLDRRRAVPDLRPGPRPDRRRGAWWPTASCRRRRSS